MTTRRPELPSLVATFLGTWWDLWTSGQVANVIPETLPVYTFTGQHLLLDDGNGDWRIKFLSSGVLTWLSNNLKIDLFLVGGGSSGDTGGDSIRPYNGGCGGFTKTVKSIDLNKNDRINIYVGAGGEATTGTSPSYNGGGKSSFAEYEANGGTVSSGGSGGGAGGLNTNSVYTDGGDGGSDGEDGETLSKSGYSRPGGTGQKSTTTEFGEPGTDLYSGGGGGGSVTMLAGQGGQGTPVLAGGGAAGKWGYPGGGYGGGGGGSAAIGSAPGKGAQGIVIIRNART